jgi:transposase
VIKLVTLKKEKGKKMEKKKKRVFDKEFKVNTVKLILNKEKKIAELARELKISENTLHSWKVQYMRDSADAFPGKGHQTPVEEELTRLRRENQVLKEERDILKKALGIFSKA